MTDTEAAPRRTTIDAREGGIMTTEVGTITGRVEVETALDGETPMTRVRYEGADEWYTPEGLTPPTAPDADLATVHDAAVAELSTPAPSAARAEEDAADPAPGTAPRQDATDPAAGGFGSALN